MKWIIKFILSKILIKMIKFKNKSTILAKNINLSKIIISLMIIYKTKKNKTLEANKLTILLKQIFKFHLKIIKAK